MCQKSREASSPPADPEVFAALEHLVRLYNEVHTASLSNSPEGHWVNEAFVMRLWAVLDAHHIAGGSKRISMTLPGAKEVDVCRRLRNSFGHSTGTIHSSASKCLDRLLRSVFALADQESIFDGRFILSKETVLEPMRKGAHEYCVAVLEKEEASQTSNVPPLTGDYPS